MWALEYFVPYTLKTHSPNIEVSDSQGMLLVYELSRVYSWNTYGTEVVCSTINFFARQIAGFSSDEKEGVLSSIAATPRGLYSLKNKRQLRASSPE